jgi:hypothetical protein
MGLCQYFLQLEDVFFTDLILNDNYLLGLL